MQFNILSIAIHSFHQESTLRSSFQIVVWTHIYSFAPGGVGKHDQEHRVPDRLEGRLQGCSEAHIKLKSAAQSECLATNGHPSDK
uniref:AlNc14C412G11466 protein n=1 Tax=Albugo laibachii Nc14 TaxID=890382 RepID=F0WZ60_9STRA|nr:AlNc14C412G11466 [Albugo laibachii Nc14]CCA27346.1 AlNc14C512G11997 [Albugo laibachii Nc14]|eukprot:CCA27346.1 AlNc14C512G11997 [Albugo laibachii Nc14]